MPEQVIDPKGVVSGGKTHPPGTPVEQIRATDAQLKAWRRFGQIADPDAKPAKAAK